MRTDVMDQEKDKLSALPSLRYPRAALALLSLAQLLIALDATIVFVALDAMGSICSCLRTICNG
jgi:hypothetical protein